MDFIGYFEVRNFNTLSSIRVLLESIGLEFAGCGFYFGEEEGKLVEFEAEDNLNYEEFVRSSMKGEGRISEWVADEVQLSLAFYALDGKKYVLISLLDNDIFCLGRSLGGKEGFIKFFFKLYDAVNAISGYLCSETFIDSMIGIGDAETRIEFIDHVYFAISPEESDIQHIKKIKYLKRKTFGHTTYYDRFPETFFT